jgi:hypothetical protein
MKVEFTTIQFSKEQAEFLALCQKYHKHIRFHIERGLWDKQGGSYTVNFKSSGEIENAVEHKYHYPV